MSNLKFKKEYKDLETKVLRKLRDQVEGSKRKSKHMDEKTIKVDVDRYTELTIVNDRLTFLDDDGLHYNVSVVNLEELIDLIK